MGLFVWAVSVMLLCYRIFNLLFIGGNMYRGKLFLDFGEHLKKDEIHKLMELLDKTLDDFVKDNGGDGTTIDDYGTYLTQK